MGLRYRKRVKILPGIYINISKSGISTTIGPRGASVNIGKRGTYINAGIPGTGLYERQRIDSGRKFQNRSNVQINNSSEAPDSQDYDPRILSAILIGAGIAIAIILFGLYDKIPPFLLMAFVILLFVLLRKRKKDTIVAPEIPNKRSQEELKPNKSQVVNQSHTIQEANNQGTVNKQEILLKTNEETLPLDSTNLTNKQYIVGKESEFVNLDDEMKVVDESTEKSGIANESPLEPYDPKLDLERYRYPTLDLLKHYDNIQSNVDIEEQQTNKNNIIKVLSYFGFEISSIKATIGPAITLYEITPAPGISLNRIKYYEKDIALNLSALDIRIIAPIPGKGTIGIEVPNAKPQIVSMESVINSRKFQETDFELPIALGKTITDEVYMLDLAKAPHILIAGSTGQGKSVALNVIITSLLYKKHPAELKFILIDPRIIEFSAYNPIRYHFLAEIEENYYNNAIVSDARTAISTLRSLCVELDVRYSLLQKAQARNIKIYNTKFKDRYLNPTMGHKFMPYIVTVIDSFSDITIGYETEFKESLTKLVKLGRAVGIHIVIATGRPSSDIIASEIKTYFPIRLSFRLPEKTDSRIILDDIGSESLTRAGDMLVYGGVFPVRVQCAFVDTPEVEDITSYIACQQSYNAPFPLPEVPMEGGEDGDGPDVDLNHLDPMFNEVARMVVLEQSGSTSMIQCKFSIGYNRAGRLMDQLEKVGIVGPAKGSKPREVLCFSEEDLQFKLDNLLGNS